MAASSSWDRLGQAASVMQVTGVDAFGLVAMIVQAAHTARRNRDLCRQLAQHVQIVGGLLRKLQIPELRRHPETRRPLEQLDDALLRAYKLVRSCSQCQKQNAGQLYGIINGPAVACKLRAMQEEIDRYIQLIPMITLVAAVVVARGTEEVHEDVTNSSALITPPVDDSALAGRPVSSLREVTEFLALEDEDLPPAGLSGYHEPAKKPLASSDRGCCKQSVQLWRGLYLTDGEMVEVKSWKWRHGLLLAIRKGLQYFSNVQEAMREQWRS